MSSPRPERGWGYGKHVGPFIKPGARRWMMPHRRWTPPVVARTINALFLFPGRLSRPELDDVLLWSSKELDLLQLPDDAVATEIEFYIGKEQA